MSFPKQAVRSGLRAASRVFVFLVTIVLLVLASRASERPAASESSSFIAPDIPSARVAHGRSPLIATPSSLAFGDVAAGSSRTLPATIINSGRFVITISTGSTTGQGFLISGIHLPLALAPGERFTFTVTFKPTSVGQSSGAVTATGSFGTTLTIPLAANGTAAGELLSWPRTINFGRVPRGGKAERAGILLAVGSPVTVYGASSNDVQFLPIGLPFPVVLQPGQNLPYRVVFTPHKVGESSATLYFRSTAEHSPPQQLDGDGSPAQTYTIDLSWQPSTSPVVGYNVYRSTISGGPYSRINSTPDPDTDFLDNAAQADQTYYYVTTSVNSEGQESQFSNEAEVTTP